jgi:hypothetical protein
MDGAVVGRVRCWISPAAGEGAAVEQASDEIDRSLSGGIEEIYGAVVNISVQVDPTLEAVWILACPPPEVSVVRTIVRQAEASRAVVVVARVREVTEH